MYAVPAVVGAQQISLAHWVPHSRIKIDDRVIHLIGPNPRIDGLARLLVSWRVIAESTEGSNRRTVNEHIMRMGLRGKILIRMNQIRRHRLAPVAKGATDIIDPLEHNQPSRPALLQHI